MARKGFKNPQVGEQAPEAAFMSESVLRAEQAAADNTNTLQEAEQAPTQTARSIEPPPGMKLDPRFIEKRSKRVQIVLQKSLYDRAKTQADALGISFNEYVHRALDKAVKTEVLL